MLVTLRDAARDDLPFLREMLYEAVYWRSIPRGDNPPFEEGLAVAGVRSALEDWGERDGDTAIIAVIDSIPVGAAWYRFYRESNAIRGYIDEHTPVLVLAVVRDHRRCGIGQVLLTGLIERASERGIRRLSLMVSSDNHAYPLYSKCGFQVYKSTGDSLLMTRVPADWRDERPPTTLNA